MKTTLLIAYIMLFSISHFAQTQLRLISQANSTVGSTMTHDTVHYYYTDTRNDIAPQSDKL